MQPRYAFWNQQFIRTEKVFVSADNRSFRYGDGCFETMKSCLGNIQLFEQHMDRFFDTLTFLGFERPGWCTAEYLKARCIELLHKNKDLDSGRLRITAARQDGGLYEVVSPMPLLLIQSWPLSPANHKLNENGLIVGVYDKIIKASDLLSRHKHNNFLGYAMAARHAKANGWNDALLLNQYRRTADSTIANFWWKKDDTWFTPALSEGPVAGVMRGYLLSQMKALGIKVSEGELPAGEVPELTAAFLSNSIYGIRWIKECGNKVLDLNETAFLWQQCIRPLYS